MRRYNHIRKSRCRENDVIRSVWMSDGLTDTQAERRERERERGRKKENALDVFTKVNRGGFREIRTGVGRAVKTRTDARGME